MEIDLPNIRKVLWERMRAELVQLVPWFKDYDLLLCPTCCRPLAPDSFDLEHIVPQQVTSADPTDIKLDVTRNDRSGLTLLCKAPLYVKGQLVHPLGCNSWKGRYYDGCLKTALQEGFTDNFSQHQIGLLCAAYLGLFRTYGYSVALTPAGEIMRRQFFSPFAWVSDMPTRSQMVLGVGPFTDTSEVVRSYWSEPFKFAMHDGMMAVTIRNASLLLPVSRDPTIPLAKSLKYAPPRFKLVPDYSSFFD